MENRKRFRKAVHVALSPKLYDQLVGLAEEREQTLSGTVRQILVEYLGPHSVRLAIKRMKEREKEQVTLPIPEVPF